MMEEKITSRKNPLLQQVKKLLSSKKAREEAGLFVADGTKLLQEAEEVSLCTCEECGKPGVERDVNGWITTLCSECFAKNRVK